MLIQTREQFEMARTVLLDADEVAIDTETVRTDVWTDRHMLGFATYCEVKGRPGFYMGFYFPFRHNHDKTLFGNTHNLPVDWIRDLEPVFLRTDVEWVMHNASFDIEIFKREGLDMVGHFWDTIVMAHLIDENQYNFGLAPLAKKYLGDEKLGKPIEDIALQLGSGSKKAEKVDSGWVKLPPEVMGMYAEKDCELTLELKKFLLPKLEEQELLSVYRSTGPTEGDENYIRLLGQLTSTGFVVDRKRSLELSDKARNRMREIEETLGFQPSKDSQLAHRLFASPAEGGLGVHPSRGLSQRANEEFPLGIPTMPEETLQHYSLHYPQAREVIDLALEYRSNSLADSLWYSKFPRLAGADNRLHPSFKVHGTKTGRLSGSLPNPQQFPRDIVKYPVKTLFKAPPGYELWEFDYSTLELRIATVYAEEPRMQQSFIEGSDLHHMTAELIGAYDVPGLSRENARYSGKQSNFLLTYGGGAEKLQFTLWKTAHLVVDLATCEQWKDGFHEAYPSFRLTNYKVQAAAKARGYIKLWNGRRRHLPWESEQHKAWNSLIQGGAGQIVKTTMLMLKEDPRFSSIMVNQVHDSIWFYIPEDEVETQTKVIKEVMEWPTEKFGLPFPVDAKRIDA